MRSSARTRAAGTLALILATAPGCSVLIHPDDSRLNPPDASASDGSVVDVASDRGPGNDTGGDVIRPTDDVPVRTDVAADRPIVDDRVTPPDDVVGDQPTVDVPPQCPASCDDGVACTVDTCVVATGQCSHMPDDTQCPNGRPFCDPIGGCSMRPCTSNADCDDHDACNGAETCGAGGQCASGQPLVCDDGRFCNGTETCDPARGCVSGTAPTCNDGTDCTVDSCDAATNACRNTPVDADADGAPAARVGGVTCAGGTDCNDNDPTIGPLATERCGNGIDDNCNGATDEGCNGPPANDACTGAQVVTLVSGMASVPGTTTNAMNGPQSSCGGSGGDVWYSVTYPGSLTLKVEAIPTGSADTVLSVRTSCTGADLVCNDDYSNSLRGSRLWVRPDPSASGTRTVFIIVDSYQTGDEGPFTLNVSTMTDSELDYCSSPSLFDVTAGGTVLDYQFPRSGSNTRGTCGTDGPEDMYYYNGGSGSLRVTSAVGGAHYLATYVREGGCFGATSTELGCAGGNPADLRTNTSGSGPAYIFVDGLIGVSWYTMRVLTP